MHPKENGPEGPFSFALRNPGLRANDDHVTLHRADAHRLAEGWSMDHLAVADVDTAVAPAGGDIARLRIAYLRHAHERVRGSPSGEASSHGIAYQAGAIERARSYPTPRIWQSYATVRPVDDSIARHRIVGGSGRLARSGRRGRRGDRCPEQHYPKRSRSLGPDAQTLPPRLGPSCIGGCLRSALLLQQLGRFGAQAVVGSRMADIVDAASCLERSASSAFSAATRCCSA